KIRSTLQWLRRRWQNPPTQLNVVSDVFRAVQSASAVHAVWVFVTAHDAISAKSPLVSCWKRWSYTTHPPSGKIPSVLSSTVRQTWIPTSALDEAMVVLIFVLVKSPVTIDGVTTKVTPLPFDVLIGADSDEHTVP